MVYKKHTISRRIVWHNVLITTLSILALTAVSCLFIFGRQVKEATSILSTVQNAQNTIIQTYISGLQTNTNIVQQQITPFLASGSITAPATLDAIAYRIKANQPEFMQMVLLKENTILYGATKSFIPVDDSVVSIGKNGDGSIESYTIWYTYPEQNIRLGIDYAMQPLMTQLFDVQEGHAFPVSSTIVLPVGAQQWQIELVADALLRTTIANQVNTTHLQTNLNFWKLLTKQSSALQLAYTNTANNWQMQTSVSAGVLEVIPVSLARYLLVIVVVLFALATVLAHILAKTIIEPIIQIQKKIKNYETSQTEYVHTLTTGDELSLLDATIETITSQLTKACVEVQNSAQLQEQHIQHLHHKDHTLLNTINIGLLVINKEGIVTEENDALLKILHLQNKSQTPMLAWQFLQVRQRGIVCNKESHPAYIALTHNKEIRLQPDEHVAVQTSDGSWIPVRLIVTPIQENGIATGVIVLLQDAHAEYKVETLKSEFLGLVSHQLRTPIAAVQWYSELLSDPEKSNLSLEQKSYMVELRLAVQRLSNIVTEMLDADRLHNGEIIPQAHEFNFIQLVHAIADDAKSITKQKSVEVNILHLEDAISMHSDPILIGIILQNILNNALKYSTQNATIRVRIEQTEQNILCHVSDDGIGIPQADQGRIFQKLFRSKNALIADPTGSGLGLYACKKIIKKLGGDLTFNSIENKGSTFTMRIPKQYKTTV